MAGDPDIQDTKAAPVSSIESKAGVFFREPYTWVKKYCRLPEQKTGQWICQVCRRCASSVQGPGMSPGRSEENAFSVLPDPWIWKYSRSNPGETSLRNLHSISCCAGQDRRVPPQGREKTGKGASQPTLLSATSILLFDITKNRRRYTSFSSERSAKACVIRYIP